MEQHTFKPPQQCHLWVVDGFSSEELDSSLELIETFVEESANRRTLFQCSQCGQQYYHEYHEDQAWEGGVDRYYMLYIPVHSHKDVALLNNTDYCTILNYFPRLQSDYNSKGANYRWLR